jgi:hypothetical protein
VYTGYVVNNQLGVYTYDTTGRLSFAGAAANSGLAICWLEVGGDGRFLYTSNSGTDSISVYSLADPLHPVEVQNLTLGGPKSLIPQPAPALYDTLPFQLGLDPTGTFLFVLNHEGAGGTAPADRNALHVLSVDPLTGLLSETVAPALVPVPAATNPKGVAVVRLPGDGKGSGNRPSSASGGGVRSAAGATGLLDSPGRPPLLPPGGPALAPGGPGSVSPDGPSAPAPTRAATSGAVTADSTAGGARLAQTDAGGPVGGNQLLVSLPPTAAGDQLDLPGRPAI